MDFWNAFASLFSNFGNLTWQMVVMWGIGALLILSLIHILDTHGCQHDPGSAVGVFQHGAEQMLRLGPAQVGVLRPDDGVVHRPAQVRRHIAPVSYTHLENRP